MTEQEYAVYKELFKILVLSPDGERRIRTLVEVVLKDAKTKCPEIEGLIH